MCRLMLAYVAQLRCLRMQFTQVCRHCTHRTGCAACWLSMPSSGRCILVHSDCRLLSLFASRLQPCASNELIKRTNETYCDGSHVENCTTAKYSMAVCEVPLVPTTSSATHGLGAGQTLRRLVVERWRDQARRMWHLLPRTDWVPSKPCDEWWWSDGVYIFARIGGRATPADAARCGFVCMCMGREVERQTQNKKTANQNNKTKKNKKNKNKHNNK